MHFSKHLELVKCLQVYLYIFSFFSFLSTCVTSADLRHEGKVEDLIELLMLFHKSSEKISNFRLSFGSGYPKSEMFYLFSGYEFLFQYLPQSISSKAHFIHFLQLFWIARMLGWSLYFRIVLKVGSLTLFITGSKLNID